MRFFAITALALCLTSGSSQITRQECEDQGGVVVGDIGDGAIFRQDYLCDIDGLPPTDVVVAGADEPIAIEGEVCCGGNGVTSGTRPEMSVDECESQGGVITYDIGDGSIHRDDYLCEVTGLPPIGTVIARSGESIPREGQVCCPAPERDEYTREECEGMNGIIVGDIGDGAIFKGDYVCDSNGLPPIANIVQDEEPFAIEGEVCCGGNGVTSGTRPEMSVDECEFQGGVITYDIGDGSIHRDDYLCKVTGLPPIGTVIARSGESIPHEGQVCCPAPERDEYTREECKGMDGIIVGDIGDGAIFKGDYVCDSNGLPPIANILQDEEPFAIEGEVCCGKGVLVTTMAAERDEVSRQECEDLGGEIVGDIGDGATQSDNYVCESNGQAPIANVVAAEGEPIASEGEVCCAALSEIDHALVADGAFALSFARLAGLLAAFCLMNLL